MSINIKFDDSKQKIENRFKKTTNIGLKGGKADENYSKLSNVNGEFSNSKSIRDQEKENFEKAMENSMNHNIKPKFQDKLDKTVKRENNLSFIGMANLGNTCYFNSIMQILFFSDCFANKICQYDPDTTKISNISENDSELNEEDKKKIKMKKIFLENGTELIQEIQIMFGRMLKGKINYANPQGVLDHLMEKMNNRKVEVGLQKDLVEFLGIFFECIEAGFSVDKNVKFIFFVNF